MKNQVISQVTSPSKKQYYDSRSEFSNVNPSLSKEG